MPFPDSVPLLTDGVVRLRPHRPGDIDRIVEQCTDAQSLRWTLVPRGYTPAMAREWLGEIAAGWDREDGQGNRIWAIEEVSDERGHFLGSIDLRPRAGGRAEIGYGLHPQARGLGLMARAVRLAVGQWFGTGGLRVDWFAERGNFSSWSVARAAGFRFVATLPGHHTDGEGNPVDTWFATRAAVDSGDPVAPWFHPPVLVRDGIRLRPWSDDDLPAVEEPSHAAHHVLEGSVPTPENFARWLLRRRENLAFGTGFDWCIADADTDTALGDACLFGFDQAPGAGEIGYQLFPSARGRGAATTAARLVGDWALQPVAEGGYGLRRVVAFTLADNTASSRVLERAGFVRSGVEHAVEELPDGGFVDGERWERLATRPT